MSSQLRELVLLSHARWQTLFHDRLASLYLYWSNLLGKMILYNVASTLAKMYVNHQVVNSLGMYT